MQVSNRFSKILQHIYAGLSPIAITQPYQTWTAWFVLAAQVLVNFHWTEMHLELFVYFRLEFIELWQCILMTKTKITQILYDTVALHVAKPNKSETSSISICTIHRILCSICTFAHFLIMWDLFEQHSQHIEHFVVFRAQRAIVADTGCAIIHIVVKLS